MIIKKTGATHKNALQRAKELIDYVVTAQTDEGGEKCLHYEGFNFFAPDVERMKAEMTGLATASQNRVTKGRSFIQHWVMSWGELEKPDIKEVVASARAFLEDMGMKNHQAVVGIHINTENIHVHMAVSRIDPMTHALKNDWKDEIRCHAVLAGIERAMGAEPERNAMFTWNICEGPTPNKKYRPGNSLRFAYAPSETVQVILPKDMEPPVFPMMKRKGNCWFYPGRKDAAAILRDDKIWFLNWAYKDTLAEIMKLKEAGAKIVAQKDLAHFFLDNSRETRKQYREFAAASFQGSDEDIFTGLDTTVIPWDPQVSIRSRPPTYPLEIRELRHKRNPWKYYCDVAMRYKSKGVPDLKIRAMVALHMRAHSIPRRQIEECLRRDGMVTSYASHLTRWLYSPHGNLELFRQKSQNILFMEEDKKLKVEKEVKSRYRMRFGLDGRLLVGEEKEKPPLRKGLEELKRERLLMRGFRKMKDNLRKERVREKAKNRAKTKNPA